MWLVIFAVLCAAISAFYYFRVIQSMYFKDGENQAITVNRSFKWGLILLCAAIIFLGVYPQWLFLKLYF
jgi:NADH-quinone oxidoreductase subunit N